MRDLWKECDSNREVTSCYQVEGEYDFLVKAV